ELPGELVVAGHAVAKAIDAVDVRVVELALGVRIAFQDAPDQSSLVHPTWSSLRFRFRPSMGHTVWKEGCTAALRRLQRVSGSGAGAERAHGGVPRRALTPARCTRARRSSANSRGWRPGRPPNH